LFAVTVLLIVQRSITYIK